MLWQGTTDPHFRALLHEYNAVFGKDDTKTIKTAIVDLKLLLFKLGFEVELDVSVTGNVLFTVLVY